MPVDATTESHMLDVPAFRRALMKWYKANARKLPWRGVDDPYRIWVSEIMLQQTRVNAVVEHYHAFLKKFPTIVALALAPEQDVLAVWSGLGYYRRARMLHKAAQFILREHQGALPHSSAELQKLPGIGAYTSAAIASIAFGERVPVVDGNVERVLLRVSGRPEDSSKAARDFVHVIAARLANGRNSGDHNQAMMELGATVCLPRGPLCKQCPVFDLCLTRGEHVTAQRAKMRSREVAYMLALRKKGVVTEVLLTQRPQEEPLMAGMWELPQLPLMSVAALQPMLRVRHSITNTNYYVTIFAANTKLRRAATAAKKSLEWKRTSRLNGVALTGLARKVLQRLNVMHLRTPLGPVETLAPAQPVPDGEEFM